MGSLYIVRHGQTQWNLQGKMQGRMDSPLTETGELQARKLGKWLADIPFHGVFASSAGRAVTTAQIIGEGRSWTVTPLDSLQEAAFGPWEGLSKELIKDRWEEPFRLYWEDPAAFVPLEGMETFEALESRCRRALEIILKGRLNQNLLVVTHGVTSAMLLNVLQNRPWSQVFAEPFKTQTSVSLVDFSGFAPKIIYRGRTDHLT